MGDRAQDGDGVLGGDRHASTDGPVACFAQDASFAGGSLGRPTPTPSCGDGDRRSWPRCRSSGLSIPPARACRRALPPWPDTGGSSAPTPRCRVGPADLDRLRRQRRRRLIRTGAHRHRDHDPPRQHVPDRPRHRAEVTGEDVDADALGGPRVHDRNGVCHAVAETDVDAALARPRPARPPSAAFRRCPPAVAAVPRPTATRRPRSARSSPVYDVRHVSAAWSTAAAFSRSAIAGRATSCARSLGSTVEPSASSPTSPAISGRPRRRIGDQGRALRTDLRHVRTPARRAGRYAGFMPGAARNAAA